MGESCQDTIACEIAYIYSPKAWPECNVEWDKASSFVHANNGEVNHSIAHQYTGDLGLISQRPHQSKALVEGIFVLLDSLNIL